MEYSRKISERMWNLRDKGELESRRETTFIDDIVQKSHIEKELLANLDGIETVFDGGAGCGRFSILLAKQGCKVTHFDISQPMIDKAKELAKEAGVSDRITFVKGALEDLSTYHAYKSGSVKEEAEAAEKAVKILGGKLRDIQYFDLPGSEIGRSLVIIEKVKNTPGKYPRKAGTPLREPLA